MLRAGKLHAIHTDHLGTPRLITNETNTPQWQWPYSAFGDNAPTGILKPTTSAGSAFTSIPATQGSGTTTATLLAVSNPTQINNLRFPGQYADSETGLFYNYYRTYQPNQGRYTQNDPIGLSGGMNRFGYVGENPLSYTDPEGLLIMSTLGGVQRNTTLDQAATYGAPGNAAAATGLAGSVGGAAVAGAGGAYRVYVPAAGRVAIGLVKGLRDEAMPPPMPPRPPLLNPPPIVRPGGFSPPAPPPGFCPRP
jgi:RHS repeat-associated protein